MSVLLSTVCVTSAGLYCYREENIQIDTNEIDGFLYQQATFLIRQR